MKVPHLALWTTILADSSLWVEGQRRWVWLKGCVARPEQVLAIEKLVRNIDDVEAVINQLTVIGR